MSYIMAFFSFVAALPKIFSAFQEIWSAWKAAQKQKRIDQIEHAEQAMEKARTDEERIKAAHENADVNR